MAEPTGEIRAYFDQGARTQARVLASQDHLAALESIAVALAQAFDGGHKVLLCGNGGSAADSQHVATELVVRLSSARDRRALPAIALTTDTSSLTACANDYTFDRVFARQVEALGQPGDVLIGISTSGNSGNVIAAFETAKEQGLVCVLFSGGTGGKLLALADLAFVAPSSVTSHIQEAHLTAYHAVCFRLETLLFGELDPS